MISKEIVLLYCLFVLNERVKNDTRRAWHWRIKRKVVLFFLHEETGLSKEELFKRSKITASDLSKEEKNILNEEYPLLQKDTGTSIIYNDQLVYYKKIKERVRKYMEKDN